MLFFNAIVRNSKNKDLSYNYSNYDDTAVYDSYRNDNKCIDIGSMYAGDKNYNMNSNNNTNNSNRNSYSNDRNSNNYHTYKSSNKQNTTSNKQKSKKKSKNKNKNSTAEQQPSKMPRNKTTACYLITSVQCLSVIDGISELMNQAQNGNMESIFDQANEEIKRELEKTEEKCNDFRKKIVELEQQNSAILDEDEKKTNQEKVKVLRQNVKDLIKHYRSVFSGIKVNNQKKSQLHRFRRLLESIELACEGNNTVHVLDIHRHIRFIKPENNEKYTTLVSGQQNDMCEVIDAMVHFCPTLDAALQQLMAVEIKINRVCHGCNKSSPKNLIEMILSVPAPERLDSQREVTIQELLDQFQEDRTLHDVWCDSCGKHDRTESSNIIILGDYFFIQVPLFDNYGKPTGKMFIIDLELKCDGDIFDLQACAYFKGKKPLVGHYTMQKRLNNNVFFCNDDYITNTNSKYGNQFLAKSSKLYCLLYKKRT